MELNIISFNIKCCDDPDGYSISERAPRLRAVISMYETDLIGFQEYSPEWEPYIDNYYMDKYDMFNKYRAKEVDVESTPILWRKDKFECVGTGYFWLSDTPEIESRGWDERYNCFRMCAYVILREKKTEKLFTFMNTHFGFGDKGQVKSAKLIYNYSQKISSYPTFIVGDFNMTPDSLGYAAMTERFTDVNAATVNDLRTTYHGYTPQKFKEHIDYCFIDEKCTPVHQKIIDDMIDNKFPSDHYGLHIKLKL